MVEHGRAEGLTGAPDGKAVHEGGVVLEGGRGLGRHHVYAPRGTAVVALAHRVTPPQTLSKHTRSLSS